MFFKLKNFFLNNFCNKKEIKLEIEECLRNIGNKILYNRIYGIC